MKPATKVAIALLVPLLFLSCASVSHYEPIDAAVMQGDYQAGYALAKEAKETAYRDIDGVLYNLDAGMLSHYAGDFKESQSLLGEAERGIEDAYTKSVSREVSSYLVNDLMKEYGGEDYEDIYLNVFNALNYYYAGSTDDALVEIRRIDNKIKYLSTKYGEAISNAQKAALEKNSEVPYNPESATTHFSNSALAQYLGMLFYRGSGKRDDARINRDQVKLAFANQSALYPFPVPSSLDGELDIPRDKARLNVLSFSGFGPMKTENMTRIPLGMTNWVKIALPEMVTRPSLVARAEVVLDSGAVFPLEQIEDLGNVALDTFRQRAALIYLKTVIRSITKTGTAMALNEQSESADSSDAALLLSVLSLGTQIYAEASEQADLRVSRYFPAAALVGGITVDPGIYSFSVKYYDGSNNLVHEVRFHEIEVRSGQLNLSEAICIK